MPGMAQYKLATLCQLQYYGSLNGDGSTYIHLGHIPSVNYSRK